MRNLKRVLSLALACVMVIGMMVMTTGAADLKDYDEITNVEAVDVMAALGVLEGDDLGNFNPTKILTREEAAKIICYMLMGPDKAKMLTGTSNFTDVAADRWSAPYISYCNSLGILSGNGDGTFNPEGKLTGVAFAKMLLVALGYDASAEGYVNNDNWATNIGSDAIEAGLSIKGVNLDAALTRENAAQMAFQALTQTIVYYDGGMNVTTSDGTTVTVGATRYNKSEGIFDSGDANDTLQFFERYFEGLAKNDTTKIADAYGRPGYTWEIDNDAKNDVFVAEEPFAVYTENMDTPAGKKAITDTFKGYTVALTKDNNYVDGKAEGATGDSAVVTALTHATTGINNLTGDTAVVEVYVDKATKTVTNIVKINTYADTVATVTEADEETDTAASITLTGGAAAKLTTIETDKFAQNDVVLYTKVYNATAAADASEDRYDVVTIETADAFTGTLTSYTSDDKYTINGDVYEVSGISGVLTNDATVKSYIGVAKVYHLDANGDIIAATVPTGAAPVVIKDYLVVMDSNLKVTADAWAGTKEVSAQVKVVLSDGTAATYDLPLTKLAADDANNSLDKGDYVLYIGNTPTEIVDKAATNATAGQTALNTALGCTNADQPSKVFTYTLNGTELKLAAALAAFDGAETASKVVLGTNSAAGVDKTSIAITDCTDKTIIANADTVFVLKTATGFVVKTGVTALEDTTIASGDALIVTNVTKGETVNTNVATVVFAVETTFAGATATNTNDLIYVDGKYTYTEKADGTPVYTYIAIKADGSTVSVTGAGTETEGIYKIKTDGTIGDSVAGTEYIVGLIAGTTADVNGYKTVTENTKVVVVAQGASFVTGSKVFYADTNTDGVIDLIYVTEKAAD